MAKKKKVVHAEEQRRRQANRKGLVLVLFAVMILASFAVVRGRMLYQQNLEYLERCEELENKISEENERKKALLDYQEYIKTEAFAEWYAKEYLGLVQDDWIIFESE